LSETRIRGKRVGRARNTERLRRSREDGGDRVSSFELFFDLVYVFAVTQLSHRLLDHLSIHGALQTLLLLFAVWWAWVYTAWITNWFDPGRPAVRLVLIAVMFGSLIMATAIPSAFDERGLVFAGAYAALQFGRGLWAVIAFDHDPSLQNNFQRLLTWTTAAGVLWVAGGFAEGTNRELLWIAAFCVDYAAPALGFWVPGLGRSTTQDWMSISGEHMAERCQLFMIVALGESILVTGGTFSALPFSWPITWAFVAAFFGSVALWWIYFARKAEVSSHVIARSSDPGRLGRAAYTYAHLPMVAGIIVSAVADELTIAHPMGHADSATVWTILGGVSLFILGHALFLRAIFGVWSVPRLVAGALLLAAIPFGPQLSPLAIGVLAMVVVVALAAWDSWATRHSARLAAELV